MQEPPGSSIIHTGASLRLVNRYYLSTDIKHFRSQIQVNIQISNLVSVIWSILFKFQEIKFRSLQDCVHCSGQSLFESLKCSAKMLLPFFPQILVF